MQLSEWEHARKECEHVVPVSRIFIDSIVAKASENVQRNAFWLISILAGEWRSELFTTFLCHRAERPSPRRRNTVQNTYTFTTPRIIWVNQIPPSECNAYDGATGCAAGGDIHVSHLVRVRVQRICHFTNELFSFFCANLMRNLCCFIMPPAASAWREKRKKKVQLTATHNRSHMFIESQSKHRSSVTG